MLRLRPRRKQFFLKLKGYPPPPITFLFPILIYVNECLTIVLVRLVETFIPYCVFLICLIKINVSILRNKCLVCYSIVHLSYERELVIKMYFPSLN